DSVPYSRVIEINPATNEIAWKYQDKPTWNFFSPRMGYAQRLPNGNTLITESSFGRFFEVTKEGEIVWEYVNPFFGRPFFGGPPLSKRIQGSRGSRYGAGDIAGADARVEALARLSHGSYRPVRPCHFPAWHDRGLTGHRVGGFCVRPGCCRHLALCADTN